MARSTIPPPPRGIEAALSSFAAPSTGIHSKSKLSNVRVVARIRPMNEEEKHCIASIHPVLPEAAPPPIPGTGLLLPEASRSQSVSLPLPTRKGPFAFLSPTKMKKGHKGSKSPQRDAEATPVIRNGHKDAAPSLSRPPFSSPQCQSKYGTAKSLTAQQKFFEFDAVFAPEATQKEVYDRSVGDAVRRNIFRGYNTTIIAYGQTGSGKTFTMGGRHESEMAHLVDLSPTIRARDLDTVAECSEEIDLTTFEIKEDDGIIPRAVHDLFKAKQRHESAGEVTIHLTYLEIYNDELRDLLVDEVDYPVGLKISDQGDDGVVIKGLSSVVVKSPGQVKQMMDAAAKRRMTASTTMNMRSSRSHAICSLLVTIDPAIQDASGSRNDIGNRRAEVISAKLTLVDLAGSERIKETGVVGIQQQGSINISKDLFVLGKVVAGLAEKSKGGNSSTRVHVPYRDSKLTRLLRDSLGGNCCTVIVACISPTDRNLDESVNTLRYAQRARTITNSIKQNVIKADMSPAECAALRGENKMLRTRVLDLQKRIQHLESKPNDSMSVVSTFTTEELSLADKSLDESLALKNEEQASFLMKNLSLESLDVEINEKKEVIEQLRIEAAKLEATVREKQTESVPSEISHDQSMAAKISRVVKSSSLDSLDAEINERKEVIERLRFQAAVLETALRDEQNDLMPYKISGSHAALGTNIEMVTLSKAVANDSAQSEALQKLCKRFVVALESLGEKRDLLATENKRLWTETSSQTLQIVSLVNQEKENEEKITSLILQLEFEQQRLREHEESLLKMRTELHEVIDERDSYRMKLAIQADELDKKQRELAAMEKHALEVEVLRSALEQSRLALKESQDEAEGLKRIVDEKENRHQSMSTHLKEDDQNKGILSPRNQNMEDKPKFESSKIPSMNDSSCSDPLNSSFNTTGNDSAESDHNAIRAHAAKLLLYANKAIERGPRGSRSTCSSFASSDGSDFKPNMRDIRTIVNESGPGPPPQVEVSATASGKPPRAIERMSSARKTHDNDQGPIISNIDQVKECSCSTNPFVGNQEHVDFYLPKLGVGCTCGKNVLKLSEGANPMALVNILRPWQVDFLKTENITTAEELVNAYKKEGGVLAAKMRKWRKDRKLVSVKTKSCGIALHIWSRTSKTVIRSVLAQLAAGVKEVKMPDILELSCDNRTAVSSLGCGSVSSLGGRLAEF